MKNHCEFCGLVANLKKLAYAYANVRACLSCRWKFYGEYYIDQKLMIEEIRISKQGGNHGTHSTFTTA